MVYTDYEAYPVVERNYKDTVFRMLFPVCLHLN